MNSALKKYLNSVNYILALPVKKNHASLTLEECAFDAQLLSLSSLYRHSRKTFLQMNGEFHPKVCSTMRSLSTHDLFANHIEYSPLLSEVHWFKDHSHQLADPEEAMAAILRFSEISLFHEQNHRILWQLLPPAPEFQDDLRRYLNFAESLVVVLDLALGDELGKEQSQHFENVRSIYRPGGEHPWAKESKAQYREYLLALLATTYLSLELIVPEDIPKAVEYYFPGQKKMVRAAVKRGLQLSELFTQNTNRQWQSLYWQQASKKLSALHKGSDQDPLYLPEDPLDLDEEFVIARHVLNFFGL
ncbi:hypothetical protein ACES2L_08910 [Bdellovibrio bacteriovorus]